MIWVDKALGTRSLFLALKSPDEEEGCRFRNISCFADRHSIVTVSRLFQATGTSLGRFPEQNRTDRMDAYIIKGDLLDLF